MAPALIGALVQGGLSIYQMAQAKKKENEAKRLAEQNKRPTYQIPESEYDTQALLRSRAGQGLSDASKQYFDNNANNALDNTLNTVLRGGGDVNSVANAYQASLDARSKLALADDAARLQNIQALVQNNARMSDNADKAFQINQFAPYADRAQYANGLVNASQVQMNNGLNSLAGAAALGLQSIGDKSRVANVVQNSNKLQDRSTALGQPVTLQLAGTQRGISNPIATPNPLAFNQYNNSYNTSNLTPEQMAIFAQLQTQYPNSY